jgi:hypothetical protein
VYKTADKCRTRAGFDPCPRLLFQNCLLDSAGIRTVELERLHVGSLPSLGALDYVELHGLAFLQTLETA